MLCSSLKQPGFSDSQSIDKKFEGNHFKIQFNAAYKIYVPYFYFF